MNNHKQWSHDMLNVDNKALKAKLRQNNFESSCGLIVIFRDYACYLIEINFLFNVGNVTLKSM